MKRLSVRADQVARCPHYFSDLISFQIAIVSFVLESRVCSFHSASPSGHHTAYETCPTSRLWSAWFWSRVLAWHTGQCTAGRVYVVMTANFLGSRRRLSATVSCLTGIGLPFLDETHVGGVLLSRGTQLQFQNSGKIQVPGLLSAAEPAEAGPMLRRKSAQSRWMPAGWPSGPW
jgi:hypothetical protein